MNGKRLFQVLMLICSVVSVSVVAEDTRNDENNPLSLLNRNQRRHYEIFADLITKMQKHEEFDRRKAFSDCYQLVRDWCAVSAPKFEYESMKAGDKAKAVNNERMKKQWIEMSALYIGMQTCCKNIVGAYAKRKQVLVMREMNKFLSLEQKAKAMRYPLPRRDWLTYGEAEDLVLRLQASRPQRNMNRTPEQTKANYDDDEPRQGHVRNSRRTTRNQNVTGGQRYRRGNSNQYNRRDNRQRRR